ARERARRLGVIRCDAEQRVVELVEKPQGDADLARLRTPADWLERRQVPAGDRAFLGNMGVYLFSRRTLQQILEARVTANALVREFLAPGVGSLRVWAHLFDGYWDDLGSIQSYHAAHLALAGDEPPFDFHSPEGVIYTRMRNLPPAQVRDAQVEQCL